MTTTREVLDAAERLRDANRMYELDDAGDRTDRGHELMMRDEHILAHDYLAETDPSEITPERLEADGWAQTLMPDDDAWTNGGAAWLYHGRLNLWHFGAVGITSNILITTMGQLRTYLRLSKGGG